MKKLTMDLPVSYQIIVPGELSSDWADWGGKIHLNVELSDKGPPITILTGVLDQAGLLGLIRQLNSLGIPLISVVCLEYESNDRETL